MNNTSDLISDFFRSHLVWPPFLLLFAEESGVPLPVPGDIIIALIGYQVAKGHISYLFAFIALLIAILGGSSILFYLSSRFGQRLVLRLGKYIHLDEKKLLVVEEKFKKYGPWVIIIGRHIPGFRIPITVFAGMSKITYKTFILSTIISIVPWIAFYMWLGAKLGPKALHLFELHHGYLLFLLIPMIIIVIFFWMERKKTQTKK